ncbi:MAG: gas vesicle protein GvpG [Deltaproteobacteria bacterium]|nr:gas vesicle protein GvpG [Deltaproteobacteria bacterium]
MAFLIDDMLVWLADKLQEAAEAEMYDESAVRASLLNLQMRLEMGEIDEQYYMRQETTLLKRLEEIRRYREKNRQFAEKL